MVAAQLEKEEAHESSRYRTGVRRRSASFSDRSRRATVCESYRASSVRQSRLAGMDGGLQSEGSVGRENQGVDRPRRRRANSLPILHRRPHGGGEARWGGRRSDQGGYRRVGAGAENEY